MRLKKLVLEQFRNYKKLELEFGHEETITSIVGENAQGKTNILEAIYLLALTKSFRTNKHQDIIAWEHEYARVKGSFDMTLPLVHRSENKTLIVNTTEQPSQTSSRSSQDSQIELEVFLGNPPHSLKSLKKNGVTTSTADFIGTCQIVFFHPEDLNMLYLGPDLRRRYLDVLNIQVSKAYFKAFRTYHHVMEQRNALLQAIRENRALTADLEIWNEQLIEHGSLIMLERAKTVAFFQEHIAQYYQKISQAQEQVKISYKHTLPDFDLQSIRKIYKETLMAAQPKDIQTKYTTIGPHRDDIEFFLNNMKLHRHASRGEYRSLLLALKLLELKFFQQKTGQKPLLLLDDVFSELDPKRQYMLLEAIENHQTIITATQEHQGEFFNQLKENHPNLQSHLEKKKILNLPKTSDRNGVFVRTIL